jgi:hypothetical protein
MELPEVPKLPKIAEIGRPKLTADQCGLPRIKKTPAIRVHPRKSAVNLFFQFWQSLAILAFLAIIS